MSSCETLGMRAYSKDLRLRVLAACDRGMSRKEVAETFGVSVATIKRYLKLRRKTGGVEPKPIPAPRAPKRAALEKQLPAQVKVSAATVSRALKDLGLPLKKRP